MSNSNPLRAARAALGLSQEAVAHRLGVSYLSYSRWERGDATPTGKNALKLARFFHMPIESVVTSVVK